MPSPIAHGAVGYVIYRFSKSQLKTRPRAVFKVPFLLVIQVGLVMLPDFDSGIGIILGDFGRYHNNGTHSVILGLLLALVVSGLSFLIRRKVAWGWSLVVLIAYTSHVVMDYFTLGRGVMLFWPLQTKRYLSPWLLFYGLHWSDGFFSPRHLITLATEFAFALLLITAASWAMNRSKKLAK